MLSSACFDGSAVHKINWPVTIINKSFYIFAKIIRKDGLLRFVFHIS